MSSTTFQPSKIKKYVRLFFMSQNDCILRELNLKDKNIHFTVNQDGEWNYYDYRGRGDKQHKCLIYTADLSYIVTRCRQCGMSGTVERWGWSKTEMRLVGTSQWDVRLALRKQRFHCKNCGDTFTAASTDFEKNCQISKNTKILVHQNLDQDLMTEKMTAKHLHISPNSVQRIEYAELLSADGKLKYTYNYSQQLPESISMDEFRSANGKFSFIWCDATSKKQFEVLPSRDTKTIKKYFLGFPLKNRKRVKHVVMDMNAQYSSFIGYLFPNAQIIIDGFHIVQRIGKALDNVRKSIQNSIEDKQHDRVYKIMKSQWKLFHMQYEDIENTTPYYLRGINERMTQDQAMHIVFEQYPEFAQVWTAYQEILIAMHQHDVKVFKNVISNYRVMGNDMDSAISTFLKSYKSILNGVKSPLNNGRIEGMNHKIKQLKRSSCGYKNMAHLLWRARHIF